MKPAIYRPSHPLLAKFVRHISIHSFIGTGKPERWTVFFPNCTTNLSITLDSSLLSLESGDISNSISTSCIRPVSFNRKSTFEMIDIQFEPFGFHFITGLPMKSFTNQFFKIDDFFTCSTLETLYQQLFDAKHALERVELIEQFLLSHLKREEFDERLIYATNKIQQCPSIDLDNLTDDLNISSRRFRDLFARHVGISPKYFARLSRFNHAAGQITCLKNSSLTEIAIATGYFDQAHFTKEFKEFGGLSPNQFRKKTEKTAVFYNFDRE